MLLRIFYFEVPISHKGYLYVDNKFYKEYDPGVYSRFQFLFKKVEFIFLSSHNSNIEIKNQEVLTKDNITLRLAFSFDYKIIDGLKVIENFYPKNKYQTVDNILEFFIHKEIQIFIRKFISNFESLELSESKELLQNIDLKAINENFKKIGIEGLKLSVKEIGFTKKIQELFTKKLESSIRAKTDLENARSVIATARALKNASSMMKDDEGIKFLYYLESILKISSNGGKHTFNIGNIEK